MRGTSSATSKSSNDNLPTLENVYVQLVCDITSAKSGHITASLAEKSFYWVLFALAPLRATDILTALSLGHTLTCRKYASQF